MICDGDCEYGIYAEFLGIFSDIEADIQFFGHGVNDLLLVCLRGEMGLSTEEV